MLKEQLSYEVKFAIAFVGFIFFLLLWRVDFGAGRNEVDRSNGSYLQEACNDCDSF